MGSDDHHDHGPHESDDPRYTEHWYWNLSPIPRRQSPGERGQRGQRAKRTGTGGGDRANGGRALRRQGRCSFLIGCQSLTGSPPAAAERTVGASPFSIRSLLL